eukprot:4069141-Pyramimonas_sp.AAC.2
MRWRVARVQSNLGNVSPSKSLIEDDCWAAADRCAYIRRADPLYPLRMGYRPPPYPSELHRSPTR